MKLLPLLLIILPFATVAQSADFERLEQADFNNLNFSLLPDFELALRSEKQVELCANKLYEQRHIPVDPYYLQNLDRSFVKFDLYYLSTYDTPLLHVMDAPPGPLREDAEPIINATLEGFYFFRIRNDDVDQVVILKNRRGQEIDLAAVRYNLRKRKEFRM